MSTELLDMDGFYFTRFYGGDKRGVCYQISEGGTSTYVQLTEAQMAAIVKAYQESPPIIVPQPKPITAWMVRISHHDCWNWEIQCRECTDPSMWNTHQVAIPERRIICGSCKKQLTNKDLT